MEQRLNRLVALGSKPGLERITRLLELLDNPQKEYKCVHIAGTNGKGSTSVIISSVLTNAGYRVGRFTSPHLHSYLERITINGQMIAPDALRACLDEIEKRVAVMLEAGYDQPTEFEVLTAAALQYFKTQQVDIAVLEVGMGGRYDSTNVIVPVVSVITGIDFDHIEYLGPTLADIAWNKAGIIKDRVPVVAGPMDESCLRVIAARARELQAELHHSDETSVTRDLLPEVAGQYVDINSSWFKLKQAFLPLLGDYQLDNLATALTALGLMQDYGFNITSVQVKEALAVLTMPGRLEVVRDHPLVIVDVGHNPQGAKALAASLQSLVPDRERVLVCGVLNDKDVTGILKNLASHTREAIITRPEGPRGSDWIRVKEIWQDLFPDKLAYYRENIVEAVELGLKHLKTDEYLLVTGSFYVINPARSYLMNT